MSFLQLAVVNDNCYQLLTDGTVLQLIQGSNTQTWKVLDQNPDNVQLVANIRPGIRHVNGDVYQFKQSWTQFGTNAAKLWGWDGSFWQWQKISGKLWYEGPETHGKWEVRDTNPSITDLVRVGGSIYQLSEGGVIKEYEGDSGWKVIDLDSETVQIASDGKSLLKLQREGVIFQLDGAEWEVIDHGWTPTQIAGGDAGVFKLLGDGRVCKHMRGCLWNLCGESSDNIHIAVASSAYRVNSKGEIYLLDNDVWKMLPVFTSPSPTASTGSGVQPAEVYDGGYTGESDVLLRIGNGGAGQSGLLKVLANAFIRSRVSQGSPPFKVAWYKSDTTESIKYLQDRVVDVAITYTPVAEQIAIKQGIAQGPSHYIFREHLLLVGPPSNPANLDPSTDIVTQFTALYTAAEAGDTAPPVRFLSRFDKSATNIKDSELWVRIGQVPWATKYSEWYHQYMAYPIQALGAAAALQEYTLTDWGTYLSVDESVEQQLTIYRRGSDDADNLLLLPAHLLVGTRAQDPALAEQFAEWATSEEGQDVIAGFTKKGHPVYSRAP